VHDLEGVRLRSANIFLLIHILNFFSWAEGYEFAAFLLLSLYVFTEIWARINPVLKYKGPVEQDSISFIVRLFIFFFNSDKVDACSQTNTKRSAVSKSMHTLLR